MTKADMKGCRPLVFVHPSDEHYGADRILLDIFAALPDDLRGRAEVWLPLDLEHGTSPLCVQLERRGAAVRHMDLPIMRRAYRKPRQLTRLLMRALRLRRELLRRRPAVVYCTTSAALIAAPIARSVRVPQVLGHVQEIWAGSDRRVLGGLAGACHRLIAISGPVKESLPEHLRRRTAVVRNATPAPEQVDFLDSRSGPLRFLVASRWNGWKGHRTLLAAWDKPADPGELVVLGGPPASGEWTDVEALVKSLGRPETVHVVGEVPDSHPYLEACDVLVVPSDSPEPFGLVAVEAFARGRPVVCSAAGGLLEIVTDGSDGWLFPLGDSDALATLLDSLDRPAVAAAGQRARVTYLARFTAERYAREWLSASGLMAGRVDRRQH